MGWGAGLLALGAVAGLLALRPDCEPPAQPPRTLVAFEGTGALRAGGAQVPFSLPTRVSRAGFPAPQPLAAPDARTPAPGARALVFEAGGARLALVSLDLLLVPEALRDAIRARAPEGLELAVVATHTHSGPGGFDARILAGVAGTGWPQPAVAQSVEDAAVLAVERAMQRLAPARLAWSTRSATDLNRSRSEGAAASQQLGVLRLITTDAVHALVLVPAHPTLVGRRGATLDVDYPGRVALHEGDGVTLVLQGAGGNAAAPASGPDGPARAAAYASRIERAAREPGERAVEPAGGVVAAHEDTSGAPFREAGGSADVERERAGATDGGALTLGGRRVQVVLPGPDASRLVPWVLRGATERALCAMAPGAAELSVWRLGPLRLLLVPAEVTGPLEPRLLEAAGADALVSLADGYVGYAEDPAVVEAGRGEARRQLFGPELAHALEQAASLAGGR